MFTATLTTLIVAGLYLILLAFMFNTNGLWTTLLYKFAPFLLGAALIFIAASQSGIIHLTPRDLTGLGSPGGGRQAAGDYDREDRWMHSHRRILEGGVGRYLRRYRRRKRGTQKSGEAG